ncbi:MAG: hypothetical protein IJK42_08095 [Prevotella sp.]|nr:hypothetical protein [Prevotella sp.]
MKAVNQSYKRLHCATVTLALCMGVVMLMASCGRHGSRQLKREVDSFAVNYFNWQYHKAFRHVTPGSEIWIAYAASQVHQADIDLLRQKEKPATCEIHGIDFDDNDSTAVAHVTIRDFLRMDTIGRAASFVVSADYDIPLRFMPETQKWMVNIQAPLRPVKRME